MDRLLKLPQGELACPSSELVRPRDQWLVVCLGLPVRGLLSGLETNQEHRAHSVAMVRVVVFLVSVCLDVFRALRRSRDEVVLENRALRQQVAALLRQRPRPELNDVDRAFWIALRRSWPQWVNALLIVKADTLAKVVP
jgi:hypothetical protein